MTAGNAGGKVQSGHPGSDEMLHAVPSKSAWCAGTSDQGTMLGILPTRSIYIGHVTCGTKFLSKYREVYTDEPTF